MNLDHDQFLLARAKLSDIYEGLTLACFETNPMNFLVRLDNMRSTAIAHDFVAVAEIASTFEAALHNKLETPAAHTEIESFLSILKDAIGCSSYNGDNAESLLASVAIRFAY